MHHNCGFFPLLFHGEEVIFDLTCDQDSWQSCPWSGGHRMEGLPLICISKPALCKPGGKPGERQKTKLYPPPFLGAPLGIK